MRFDTIKYMEWAKAKKIKKIDLSKSGVENFSLKELDTQLRDMEITGENVYGYPPLLESIAEKYGVKEENIVSTLGTSHALFVVCAALIEKGDRALIEKPAYEPILAAPKAIEANVSRIDRKFTEKYQFDLDKFESLLSQRTKLVILTNLHNPSGALLNRSFLQELVEITQRRNVYLFLDEIYLDFLEGKEGESAFSLGENVIVASSLTKVYGLGGLRCGWILAPSSLVKRMWNVVDYTNVEGVFIGEQISEKVFSELDSIKVKNKSQIEKNLSLIRNFISNEKKLTWVEPAGGVVCFPRVVAGITGDELAEILINKYETVVVPGSFFEEEEHFRLGFGVSSEVLAAGLEEISLALNE